MYKKILLMLCLFICLLISGCNTYYINVNEINDTNISLNSTYSSSKIESLFINGSFDNLTVNHLKFNTNSCTENSTEGVLCWNDEDNTVDIITGDTQIIQVGRELSGIGKNKQGTDIENGQVVYMSGSSGSRPEFKLAIANDFTKSAMVGVATTHCNNNAECPVTVFGLVRGLDTSMYINGDMLYLSETVEGNFTTTPPDYPNNIIWVATVIRVHHTEGSIFVYPRVNTANGVTFHNLGIIGNLTVGENINANNIYSNYYNWTTGDDWNIFDGQILTFNESKLTTTYYNPTSANVIYGTVSGTLDLVSHNDGQYDDVTFNITERVSSPALDIRINFTNGIDRFNGGIMRYYTSSLNGDYPVIQLWDYNDNEWEDYGKVESTTNFYIIEQGVFDYKSHVQNGTVQMRLYKSSNGNINNKYYIDWLAINKGYGTPIGNEVDPLAFHKSGDVIMEGDSNFGGYDINNVNNLYTDNIYGSNIDLTGNITADNLRNVIRTESTFINNTNSSYIMVNKTYIDETEFITINKISDTFIVLNITSNLYGSRLRCINTTNGVNVQWC